MLSSLQMLQMDEQREPEMEVVVRSAPPPSHLTAAEVADILGKSKMTITRWLRDGYFDGAYQDGPTDRSPWVIPVDAVNEYLEERGLPLVEVTPAD